VLADDDPRWPRDPVDQALAACAGGAAVVQLRAKFATDRAALAWGEAIRAATLSAGALFCVNDRIDVALACGADAVHLGQEDVPPARIPSEWRARIAIGRSTHTSEQVARACDEPVDYVAFGPVFDTRSKEQVWSARGLAALAEAVARAAPRPVVAIGGIDATRVAALRAAGAAGFAVIFAAAGAAAPEVAVRELARAWRASRSQQGGEAAAPREEAERSVGSCEGEKPSEVHEGGS
jgi:thiamine-phosphate pyrophosphorylase